MNVGLLQNVGRHWWVLALYGLIAVIFGLFALIHPLAAVIALTWTCGVMALAEGLTSLFALGSRTAGIGKGWLLLYAIASLVFGLLAIIQPVAMASVLLLLVSVWLIIGGVHRIAFAIRVRKHVQGEWLVALSGAFAIVLGVLFALNPLSGLVVSALWIGAGALIYGVLQIAAGFRLRQLA